MKILVTGATGFTGSYLVPLLLEGGHQVRCLIRASSDLTTLPLEQIELAYGDLADPLSLQQALNDVEVLVNVASLGFGHAPAIVNAAVNAGVQRAIFISTTAVLTTLNAGSKSVRLAAEEAIQRSPIAYTILRPTMIYGSSRDRNMCRLIRYIRRWPLIPVIGSGEHLQQPVYVEDVALAVMLALDCPQAVGRTYNISGFASLTFNQVVDTISGLVGRKVRKLHLPLSPVVGAVGLLQRLPFRLPIKAEQILRLNENKAFDYSEAATDFGYRPRSLAEGITLELREMGLMQ